jgi:hypothetical protein
MFDRKGGFTVLRRDRQAKKIAPDSSGGSDARAAEAVACQNDAPPDLNKTTVTFMLGL